MIGKKQELFDFVAIKYIGQAENIDYSFSDFSAKSVSTIFQNKKSSNSLLMFSVEFVTSNKM